MLQNVAFYTIQLRIHLLNLPCNVLLAGRSSAIAEFPVTLNDLLISKLLYYFYV